MTARQIPPTSAAKTCRIRHARKRAQKRTKRKSTRKSASKSKRPSKRSGARKGRAKQKRTRKRKGAAKQKRPSKRKGAAKEKRPSKRKSAKRAVKKGAAKRPSKRKGAAKRPSPAQIEAKARRSEASRKGWETRRARQLAHDVTSLAVRASLERDRAERERLEAEQERKSALIREAAERYARQEAEEKAKRKEARKKRARLRLLNRIEPAKATDEPPDPEELAAIGTLMRDLEYRFQPPIQSQRILFVYQDNTVDARIKFRGFGMDWKMFLLTLSTVFQEDIVPNYEILKTWWIRLRIEMLDGEWRETIAVDPKYKKGVREQAPIYVTRRLERSAMTFEAAMNVCQEAEDDGKVIDAVDMWFIKSRQRPTS